MSIDAIQAIVEQYTQRDTRGGEQSNVAPTLLWPEERHLIPTTCPRPYCGGKQLQIDAPYGLVKKGEARCFLCTRVIVNLKASGFREAPTANPIEIDPTVCLDCEERPRATGRRVCALCASRRRHAQTAALIARGSVRCLDCGVNPRSIKHARCNVCRHKHEYAPRGQGSGT